MKEMYLLTLILRMGMEKIIILYKIGSNWRFAEGQKFQENFNFKKKLEIFLLFKKFRTNPNLQMARHKYPFQ